jgi:hypothetical protein
MRNAILSITMHRNQWLAAGVLGVLVLALALAARPHRRTRRIQMRAGAQLR